MKSFFSLLIISCSILSATLLNAQSSSDVFNKSEKVTWLGIDYSEVKFIGPASGWGEVSTKSPTEMRDKYFPAWNDLIANEPKNFKIAEAINRDEVEYKIDVTAKANEKVNRKEIFTESISEYQTLTEANIASIIKKYDFRGNKGIGFMFIAEGMSKGKEQASYWATFVDMNSKKVLLTKRVEGAAAGFGFRNYWAGSVKAALKKIKKEFKSWEK